MYVCGCIRMCLCARVCRVHVHVCNSVFMFTCVFGCVLKQLQTHSCDLNPVIGDSDWCSLWTQYTGDSKTDPWDDPDSY